MMRHLALLLACSPLVLCAQPDPPDITFTLADDAGCTMPFVRAHRVELHYNYDPQYGFAEHLRGEAMSTVLEGTALFADSTAAWRSYRVPPIWGTERRLFVIANEDTMRLDLPNTLDSTWLLVQRAMGRWDRDTPELIHFRKGHFAFADVILEAKADARANEFAAHIKAGTRAKEQAESEAYLEWHKALPEPAPPVVPYTAPPPPTEAEIAAYWAQQPKLKRAKVVLVKEDSVTISLTGRVMLTGDCASSMPIFGLEQLVRNAWVERIAVDMTQMDCGLGWGDWEDHAITLPLRWWLNVRASRGEKELGPGTYRLVFVGGDLQQLRTAAFVLR